MEKGQLWRETWGSIRWERDTPVQIAEKTDEFLKAGVDPNITDLIEKTPLMYAASKGYTEVMAKLIENGADIERKAYSGETALMYASFYGKADAVEQLVEAGAELEARDNEEKTALMFATFGGHTESVKKLVELGADVNTTDFLKETPLLHAAGHNMHQVADILVEAGADAEAQNIEGKTPLDLAYTTDTRQVVQKGIRSQRRQKRVSYRNQLLKEKENAPKTPEGRKAVRAQIEARKKEVLTLQGRIKIRENKIENLTASLTETTPQRHALAERLQELRKEHGINARRVAKDDMLAKFYREKMLVRE